MGGVRSGAASGILAALALPPFHLWPLAFLALVPLIRFLSDPGRRREDVVGAGLSFGLLHYGLLLHWGPFTLHGMVPLGALLGLLLPLVPVGLAGVQALLLHRLVAGGGVTPLLAVPVVWVSAELLLEWAGTLAMPWTPLALALAPVPELAGMAEWGGARGASFWIAGVNGGVAVAVAAGWWWRRGGGPGAGASVRWRRRAVAAGAVLVALGPAVWGVARAARITLEALPPVLLVQMNLGREELLDRTLRDAAAAGAVERLLGEAPGGGPAFALLPEAPFSSRWGPELERRLAARSGALGFPILVGAHLPDRGGNAVLRVDPEGASEVVHVKARLVPGAEWPGVARGPGGRALEVAGVRVGALVCFESAFGAEARRLRRDGAELLLNPSNDGWFRPRPGGRPSSADAQHRAHLVLRAIETRTGAVRASLGGELLVVDPVGRVVLSRPAGGEGTEVVRPLTSPVVSGFVRFGDWPGAAAALLLAGLLLRVGRGRAAPSRGTKEIERRLHNWKP